MARMVKAKSYKSKREFQDDLDLIWFNCKAEKLLRNITDRKERADPVIPAALQGPKVNGMVNGHSRPHMVHHQPSSSGPLAKAIVKPTAVPLQRRDLPFADSPALIRTQHGMSLFAKLNCDSPPRDELRVFAPDYQSDDEDPIEVKPEAGTDEKRKLNEQIARPRKRARVAPQYPIFLPSSSDDITQMWWMAAQSDLLLPNGLLRVPQPRPPKSPLPKRKKRRKRPDPPRPNPKSLLTLMNNNIRTMRRVRHAMSSSRHWEEPAPRISLGKKEVRIEDIGEKNSTDCLQWMSKKGFQEEIILHTLFESGVTRVQDVERYISDDVGRYGSRLNGLEKKLVGAYREALWKTRAYLKEKMKTRLLSWLYM
ncbi:uncharacterized protein BT62DRAFT_920312 [Guyanagaster necrorhizus]|uniref:Bromo domain-containing protein n=1 Tax=Guyanagaster necrorhizus TaxID=856835 RepID=A0A9P7VT51_9AGAR|nr:uncharacterized protein BT62DRAFT_920312 [Guyanagaster necrorhizus MCA 3950]KAG7445604.1 hypothetical protein BT62DRAFT_920312 [Guyanagaster necrorhizus MCA 3950]